MGLAASSDCQRVYVGCEDSKLYLYDVRSRELIAILIEQESSINDLKISIDNSFLFSSSGVITKKTHIIRSVLATFALIALKA